MSLKESMHAYLIFSGSGPILVLSTFREWGDERLVAKLRYKGIDRFIAYQVDLDAVRERYDSTFESVAKDLENEQDFRVLDFNGHQIMARFTLEELGTPLKLGA